VCSALRTTLVVNSSLVANPSLFIYLVSRHFSRFKTKRSEHFRPNDGLVQNADSMDRKVIIGFAFDPELYHRFHCATPQVVD